MFSISIAEPIDRVADRRQDRDVVEDPAGVLQPLDRDRHRLDLGVGEHVLDAVEPLVVADLALLGERDQRLRGAQVGAPRPCG